MAAGDDVDHVLGSGHRGDAGADGARDQAAERVRNGRIDRLVRHSLLALWQGIRIRPLDDGALDVDRVRRRARHERLEPCGIDRGRALRQHGRGAAHQCARQKRGQTNRQCRHAVGIDPWYGAFVNPARQMQRRRRKTSDSGLCFPVPCSRQSATYPQHSLIRGGNARMPWRRNRHAR